MFQCITNCSKNIVLVFDDVIKLAHMLFIFRIEYNLGLEVGGEGVCSSCPTWVSLTIATR